MGGRLHIRALYSDAPRAAAGDGRHRRGGPAAADDKLSTLEPGPGVIPDHGPVTYRGRRHLADSFDGTTFPSGVLRVSLLVPA